MLLLSLVVMGGVALVQLPLGFVPTLDEPEVDVEAPWQGAHPLEGSRACARSGSPSRRRWPRSRA
jgi:multidrug efflux pump subunit AcrB